MGVNQISICMIDLNYGLKTGTETDLQFGVNSLFGIFGVKHGSSSYHICMIVSFGIVDIEKPFAVINNSKFVSNFD